MLETHRINSRWKFLAHSHSGWHGSGQVTSPCPGHQINGWRNSVPPHLAKKRNSWQLITSEGKLMAWHRPPVQSVSPFIFALGCNHLKSHKTDYQWTPWKRRQKLSLPLDLSPQFFPRRGPNLCKPNVASQLQESTFQNFRFTPKMKRSTWEMRCASLWKANEDKADGRLMRIKLFWLGEYFDSRHHPAHRINNLLQ